MTRDIIYVIFLICMLAFACYIYVIVAMTNNPLLKRLSSLIKSEFAIKKIIKFTYGYLQVSGNKRVVLDLYDYKNEQLNLIVTQNFKSIIRKIILKYKKEKIKEKFMIIVEKHGENFDYYIVPITTSCIINVKDYIRLNYGVLASISYFDIFPEVVIDENLNVFVPKEIQSNWTLKLVNKNYSKIKLEEFNPLIITDNNTEISMVEESNSLNVNIDLGSKNSYTGYLVLSI